MILTFQRWISSHYRFIWLFVRSALSSSLRMISFLHIRTHAKKNRISSFRFFPIAFISKTKNQSLVIFRNKRHRSFTIIVILLEFYIEHDAFRTSECRLEFCLLSSVLIDRRSSSISAEREREEVTRSFPSGVYYFAQRNSEDMSEITFWTFSVIDWQEHE